MVEFVGLSEEMIGRLSLHGPQDPSNGHWKVAKIEVAPELDNTSAFAIIHVDGQFEAEFFWGSDTFRVESKSDPYAPEQARHNAASMPMFAVWGSYGVRIVGNSESISGFGLYAEDLNPDYRGHNPVFVYFEWREGEEPPPPPPEGEAIIVSQWMDKEDADKLLWELYELGDFLKTLTIEVAEN